MASTVLVVDDQPATRRVLAAELEDAGFQVVVACNGVEGWERFCEHRPDLIITDMVMPGSDGIELLNRVRSRSEVPVIMFSAHGSIETAVTALKAGADDFVSSADFESDDFAVLVKNVLARPRHTRAPSELEARLVGSSAAMARARERIAGLAPLWTPVLVSGEPGTGRDTVVMALHELGVTAGSELVRVEAGSFRPGSALPVAGVVYLDGVQELSQEAQRFWERRLAERQPGGASKELRILASTSESLVRLVNEASFQATLASALRRFEIALPPLHERREDIPALATTLVERFSRSLGRRVRLTAEAIALLEEQRWPGNVAQLAGVLERAVAFSRGQDVRRRVVEEVLGEAVESLASFRALHDAQEREMLMDAIRRTGGNVTRSAELLGKSRAAVYRLIAKHGIRLTHGR